MTASAPLPGESWNDKIKRALDPNPQPLDAHRVSLIGRMVDGVRNVAGFGVMSERQFEAAIQDWNDVLEDVPTEHLDALKKHGLKLGHRTAVEFRDCYFDLLAKLEREREDAEREARDRAYREQMQSDEYATVPDFVLAFARYGERVTCRCPSIVSPTGRNLGPPSALLVTGQDIAQMQQVFPGLTFEGVVYDGAHRYWVCEQGRCNFIVEANALPARRTVSSDPVSIVRTLLKF